MAAPVAWISHPVCARHDMGEGHPERPERLAAIEDRMIAGGLDLVVQRETAPEASREDLLRAHDAAHVDRILATQPAEGLVRVDPDTSMNAFTAAAALRAAGAGVLGVDLVLSGAAGFAFCCVRPPGHHAERAQAMGFCFFNNVAVAAAHALSRGLSRVAIFDFDVHYGNGTADIFRHDPRVLLCSTYQDPLYPFWKTDPAARGLVDVPLPAGAGGAEFRRAVESDWLPRVRRFAPELILCSAGFDAHVNDPMADLRLTDDDFHWIGEITRTAAEEHCGGRVVATLEGGYNLDALAGGTEAFVRAFLEG